MISYLLLLLQFLSLSFWIGGLATLLMIVVPSVYRSNPHSTEATDILIPLIKSFSSALIVNTIFLGVTLFVQIAFLSQGLHLKLRIALSLVSLALLISAYQRFSLASSKDGTPADRGDADNEKVDVRRQRRSLALHVVNLFLGVAVVMTLLLPFR